MPIIGLTEEQISLIKDILKDDLMCMQEIPKIHRTPEVNAKIEEIYGILPLLNTY